MDSPSKEITLELQGGEPLLAFDTIQHIVPRAKEAAVAKGKRLTIVVTSNLACVTDEILTYLRDEGVKVSTMMVPRCTTKTDPDQETTATRKPSKASNAPAHSRTSECRGPDDNNSAISLDMRKKSSTNMYAEVPFDLFAPYQPLWIRDKNQAEYRLPRNGLFLELLQRRA